ncbi:DUF417 family protein [Francisella noatunensis]|uniref:DUF417 family protein n=2 Tax=Francisella noatunensis TaxID=657445 RepID=UPI00190885B2|nr:DUF417 family protein [Francisella noatunensis]
MTNIIDKINTKKLNNIGYYLGLLCVITILIWLGIFKFTSTEAKSIQPLVYNHPLMGWIYLLISERIVSSLIGLVEIVVGLGMLIGIKYSKIGLVSGTLAAIIFITTTSFIFTTPHVFQIIENIPHIDFFLFKDLALLGITINYISRCLDRLSTNNY